MNRGHHVKPFACEMGDLDTNSNGPPDKKNDQYAHHVHLLRVLNQLNNSIAEINDLEQAFREIVRTIKSEINFGTCISLFEVEEKNLQVWIDSDRHESRYCYVLPADAIERRVFEAGRGEIFYPKRSSLNVTLLPLQEYPTLLILPISYKKKDLGILYVYHTQEIEIPDYIAEFLTQIANRIGIAVSNWYQLQESLYKTKKLKVLHKIMSAATDVDTSTDEVIQTSAIEIAKSLDFSRIIIGLVDGKSGSIRIACATADYPEKWADSLTLNSLDDLRHVEAFHAGRPIVIHDGQRDPRCAMVAGEIGLYSNVTVPIMYKDEPLGVIYADNCDYRRFQDIQLEFLMVIANQLGMVITNHRQFEYIKMLAITDGLTGLHTRQYFNERYNEEYSLCVRHHLNACLIMIDIDDFKKINDTYGHVMGDKVLVSVAHMLKNQVRSCDIVARYGGEELIVLLPQTELESGLLIANRIRESFNDLPFDFKVTASIGVAAFPDHANGPEDFLMVADDAMYRAKHEGKNQIRIANGTR
ncbi:sensor domain-containing diguanylate cyclase [Aneurinibacillus terranovensis]|uniref:sensor domain-containing diguanylate cyclase n=1 Tax=Aneurinibacillus terranovensis TaxID=278991 RepID=UPI0004261FA3|nr:diguanylate cyclase [Aneurinibacillus terranovensis]